MTVTRQKITIDARYNGIRLPKVTEISTSSGFEQINAEATIRNVVLPSGINQGQSLEIWASNGTHSGYLFKGDLVTLQRGYDPIYGNIIGRDKLARLRYAWGGEDQEETEILSDAYIRHMLEIMGIPSSEAHIEGSGWELAIVNPLVLKKGQVVYNNVSDIDELEGYKTYSLPTGIIVRYRVTGNPGSNPALTFTKGVQILSGATWDETLDGIYNAAHIKGLVDADLDIEVDSENVGIVQQANIYIPDPPGIIAFETQSDLVEDDDTAFAIAERIVSDKNRKPATVNCTIPFDPRVLPGMTIGIEHADLVGGSFIGFAATVSHNIGKDAKTTLRLLGGSFGLTELQKPQPVYNFSYYLESEDTGSGIVSYLIGLADGGLSFDPDGEITTYAWSVSATGGTVTPTSGSGLAFRFIMEDTVTEIVLNLTVTDNDSLTGELEQTIPIDASTALVEDVYVAYGGLAGCSIDGEKTWRTQSPASGATTSLCPFGAEWGNIWGTTTGHIYATFDKLLTSLVDLGQPHGAVSCTAVWINESDTTRLWAGFSDGKVYYGSLNVDAQTATWALRGTIPSGPSIVEIRESVNAFNELAATAGSSWYASSNGGSSWTIVHTFDTAWRLAAGFDQQVASGLNDPDPIFNLGEASIAVPSGVEHVRGLAFGWRMQEFYAADNTGALYLGSTPNFDLADTGDTTPAIVNHMIRSGNLDRVVYMAVGDGTGDNGFVKWVPDAMAPSFILRTGTDQGLMIGYGALHEQDNGCVVVHVPFDVGTSVVTLFGVTAGQLRIEELPESLQSRIVPETIVSCSVSVFVTESDVGASGITMAADEERTIDSLETRTHFIADVDGVHAFNVTFCNLAPA